MTIAEKIKKAHIERYEHGGGRMWYEDEKGSRHLIADFYGDGEAREYILGLMGRGQSEAKLYHADELLMTSLNTGRIVSSGDLTELQIAAARADKRFYVNPRGFGFAMLPWDLSTLKDLEREGREVKP